MPVVQLALQAAYLTVLILWMIANPNPDEEKGATADFML